LCSTSALTQEAAAPAPPAAPPLQQPDKNVPELSAQDTSTTFKVRVNLVEVRVVVRDAQGHAVGTLKQEDFQLFDNGKPQIITRFSVEQAGAKPPVIKEEGLPEGPGPTMVLPKRYIAYVFDDLHLQFGDLAQVRNAASRHLRGLDATDRAAIFTTSGRVQLDFTDDREKLIETLKQIKPSSISNAGVTECPDISYYLADQIANKNDNQALTVAAQDAIDCGAAPPPVDNSASAIQQALANAQNVAMNAARQKLNVGDHETRLSLGTLKDVVRRISAMPGQRSILIVSPGFYNPDEIQEQSDLVDRALHSYVTISALDARGLYTNQLDNAATRMPSSGILPKMQQYKFQESTADADVLSDLANSTGGTFFHGSNDLDKGFRQLAAPPEYSYLLAFAPQNLKFDGRFHNVKVTVKSSQKLAVQARKGYYAPKQAVGEAEQAKQQVQDEVFSQEELHELPVEMHTQFFKTSDEEAKLSVLVKLDVRHLHYHKANGRNNSNLTVVSALFDRNGNFVTGMQKVVEMHWKDETLDSKLASGVTLKNSFDVKPGSYVVRLVVRDDEGQLAAQNGAIEIP
jgi:VWFA-related protein